MRCLIDSDYIAYAAGFAGEHTRYLLDTNGEYAPYAERPAPELLEAATQVWTRHEVEPIENVLHSAKLMIQKIVAAVEHKCGKVKDVELYLTGTANFRERLATIRPYKGNRDPRHKPVYMRQIREYLVRQWGAKVVDWYEADDRVSIEQTRDPKGVVVCGIDKDLLQVPGLHYVPKKGFKQVGERDGLLRFYAQMLQGDNTDNVAGCYKLGKKIALGLLREHAKGVETKALGAKLWPVVLDAYAYSIEKYGAETCGYSDARAAALENARLVYMLREEPADPARPELWEAPE